MNRFFLVITVVSFATACRLFSGNDNNRTSISVTHEVDSGLPLVCENDVDILPALTENALSGVGIDPQTKDAMVDSVSAYFLSGKIMSGDCLRDNILFSKRFFAGFSNSQKTDSVQMIITRDFRDMAFNGYGFITPAGDDAVKTELLDNDASKWSISINGASHIVRIEEDPKTKNLLLKTMHGDEISFPATRPSRCYISAIKFIVKVKVFYSSGQVRSGSSNADNLPVKGNLLRLSGSLDDAKRI